MNGKAATGLRGSYLVGIGQHYLWMSLTDDAPLSRNSQYWQACQPVLTMKRSVKRDHQPQHHYDHQNMIQLTFWVWLAALSFSTPFPLLPLLFGSWLIRLGWLGRTRLLGEF